MGDQGYFFRNLREKFIEGKEGDCSLVFTRNGEEVHRQKCHFLLLQQVEYFDKQQEFSEGRDKEYTIDLSDFYADGPLSPKEFVHAAFSICIGPVDEGFEKCDVQTRYSIVKFRDYLGLPYESIFARMSDQTHSIFGLDGTLPKYAKMARDAEFKAKMADKSKRVRELVMSMICSSMGNGKISDLTIKHDLCHLGPGNPKSGGHWQCAWKILAELAKYTAKNRDLCRKVCLFLCWDFTRVAKSCPKVCLLEGFGSTVLQTLEMCYKFIGPQGNNDYPETFFEDLRVGHDEYLFGDFNVDEVVTEALANVGGPLVNVENIVSRELPYVGNNSSVDELLPICPHELAALDTVLQWTELYISEKVANAIAKLTERSRVEYPHKLKVLQELNKRVWIRVSHVRQAIRSEFQRRINQMEEALCLPDSA